jgi:hypothetical protein
MTMVELIGDVARAEAACLGVLESGRNVIEFAVDDVAHFLLCKNNTPTFPVRLIPDTLERLVTSGAAYKRLRSVDGKSRWHYAAKRDPLRVGPLVLIDYDHGSITLCSFIEGSDLYGLWSTAASNLCGLDDALRTLIAIRDHGRSIPVRCHAKSTDLGMVRELIPMVERWLVRREVPTEVQELALRLHDAIHGTHEKVENGEPKRQFG